ncbi:hypothetical protein BBJ28_00006985 [Nothophytophthora sp. Chile5]|nr:hypothetical protein BBJ28_00006985 [Nothophytophthora sp. Chile5]
MANCSVGVPDCQFADAGEACADYYGLYTSVQSSDWLLVLAFFIMAVMAFYIGANDVANAFGTSVGSKAISVKWACILGGLANWLGAVTLGYGVSDTIQTAISDVRDPECWACSYCNSQMDVFGIGMFAALIGASIFMLLATFTAMPVSTTHAIIGGVMGVTIFSVGGGCLNWDFVNGLSGIFATWLISPVLSGVIGILIYLATNYTIMASKNPSRNAILSLPILYGVCTFMVVLMILLQSQATKHDLERGYMVLISVIAMLVVGILVHILLVPEVKKRMPSVTGKALFEAHGFEDEYDSDDPALMQTPYDEENCREASDLRVRRTSSSSIVSEADAELIKEHKRLSPDQLDAMSVFRYLLVMVATLESFAHGANDTANSTGPVSAIYNVYDKGLDSCDTRETPVWIMAIAGFFVCVGILVQGHLVMKTIGSRISVMDMHRGFAMEFSSTVTVVISTLLKLPVSTTHCQVGSVLLVSLVSIGWRNVSFPMMGKIVASWCITLPFAGFVGVILTMIFRSSIVAYDRFIFQ